MERLDLLLFHAYFLSSDPHEQEIMRPFPPLGIQYIVAWLRQQGMDRVDWFDSTFAPGPESFYAELERTDPRVVGLYGHTITRPTARGMIAHCRAQDRRVIAGGPDPVQYLSEYLDAGVEVVVIGEGEQTTQALLEHLRDHQHEAAPLRVVEDVGLGEFAHRRAVQAPVEGLRLQRRVGVDVDRADDLEGARSSFGHRDVHRGPACPSLFPVIRQLHRWVGIYQRSPSARKHHAQRGPIE